MIKFIGKYTTAKVMIDYVDVETQKQIYSFINNPVFTNPIVIMPDTHAGKGSVIGFTMEMTTDKIIPNIVGVDINCGMLSFKLGSSLHTSTENIDQIIRKNIPFGTDTHKRSIYNFSNKDFNIVNDFNIKFVMAFNKKFNTKYQPTVYSSKWFEDKCKQIGMDISRAYSSIGTLGGGK